MKNLLTELEKVNQLQLTEEERSATIDFFKIVEQDTIEFDNIDTQDVEPMVYVMPLCNVLREDVSNQQYTRDELQKGAPEAEDGYWEVPRLIE